MYDAIYGNNLTIQLTHIVWTQPIGADISVDHIFVKCKEEVNLLKCEGNELT